MVISCKACFLLNFSNIVIFSGNTAGTSLKTEKPILILAATNLQHIIDNF